LALQSGGEPGCVSGYTWAEPRGRVKGETRSLGNRQESEAAVSKGFFSGIASGAVVSTLMLAGVSLMGPPPESVASAMPEPVTELAPEASPEPDVVAPATAVTETNNVPVAEPAPETTAEGAAGAEPEAPVATTPETSVVEVPAGSEFARERPDEAAQLPAAQPAPETRPTPAVAMPDAEAAPVVTDADTAAVPDAASAAPDAPTAPDTATAEAAGAVPAADTAVPVAPAGDVATPELSVAAADTPVAPAADTDAGAAPATAVEKPPAAAPVVVAEASPEAGVAPEPAPATEPVPTTESQPAPETAPKPEVAPSNIPPVIVFDPPRAPQAIGNAPKPGFGNNVPGVKINRLPKIGDPAPEAEAGAAAAEAEALPDPATLPAVARYAAPFENDAGLPTLSVVLLDIGETAGGLDAATLATIAFPVTIAIDPLSPGAAERAATYRNAGLEVAILAATLPDAGTASDLEVTYQSFLTTMPEAVAVVGTPDGPVQTNRLLAKHLVALLKSDGHGIVTYDRGLNPARQLANSDGVAHAEIYRAIDGGGETAATIRRYLDRAAFEAAQKGQAVVVAQSLPETVTALFAWSTEPGKGAVLAPVSAIARKTLPEEPAPQN
jgi:polysaccharide deacetylase 2 family uncharacterized protein YibQ